MNDIEHDINKESLADLDPIRDDAESIYEDQVGTYVSQARFCQRFYEKTRDEERMRELQRYKEEFYRKLREFIEAGFEPKRKITCENLEGFYKFENLDWSKKENMDKVNSYNFSLRCRET